MVQILVHIRPADRWNKKHFELLDCDCHTQITEIKKQVQLRGHSTGKFDLPPEKQELVFMGERCSDTKQLRDYGICESFIKQVAGFVVNPQIPGQVFQQGILRPASSD